jgi:drug/metabolite transporter (DMT)-like permease
MISIVLALAASLAYGTADFLAGLQSRRRTVWSVTAVSQPSALLVAGLLLVVSWTPPPGFGGLWPPLLGGLAGGVAVVVYYMALSAGTMSVVAPIVASCAVVPVLVGIAAGEQVSGVQSAGMLLALAGIVLSSRAETHGSGRAGLRSVLLAVVAAAAFGVMMLGLSEGGQYSVPWSVFAGRAGSTTAIYCYIVYRRPRLDLSLKAVPVLAAVGVLGVVANSLFVLAATIGYLSIVSVLAGLSPVVIAVYARLLTQERLTRVQLAAAGVVLLGVVLLTVG